MNYGYSSGLALRQNRVTTTPFNELNLALVGAEGIISVDQATLAATVQVTEPAAIASFDDGHPNGPGWFTRSLTQIQAAPVVLAPPSFSGIAGIGETLSLIPAAWLMFGDPNTAEIVFDLEVNEGTGYVTLVGYGTQSYESVSTYDLVESHSGSQFRLRETISAPMIASTSSSSVPVAVPPADSVPLPTLVGSPVNQDLDLSVGEAETVVGSFAAAGQYIVGIVNLNAGGPSDLVLEGSAITASTLLGSTTGNGNTHIQAHLVQIDDASDLIIRNTNPTISFARQIIVLDAEDLSLEGAQFVGTTDAGVGADPLSLTFTNLPADRVVLAIGAIRDGGSPSDSMWGGDLTANDELSDQSFSNPAQRAAVAAARGDVDSDSLTVSVAFDEAASTSNQFALGAIVFVNASEEVTVSDFHPGFQRTTTDVGMTHAGGWGDGNHYTFEVDPGNETRMVIEPGETTTVWYIADTETGGLSTTDIESQAGLAAGTVDAVWLASQTTTAYGLRSDLPIDWMDLGRFVHQRFQDVGFDSANRGKSNWFRFARGGKYGDGTGGKTSAFEGESALNPHVYSDFGVGPRPRLVTPTTRNSGEGGAFAHCVYQGVEREGAMFEMVARGDNLLFADTVFSGQDGYGLQGKAIDGQPINRITSFGSSFLDCAYAAPKNGSFWNPTQETINGTRYQGDDRASGQYMSKITGPLLWRCFFDHNGWGENYNPDGFTWANVEESMPPAILSHNVYWQSDNSDCSMLEVLSTRAAGTGIQFRSGGMASIMVSIDPGETGVLGAGERKLGTLDATRSGNFESREVIRVSTGAGDFDFQHDNYSPSQGFKPLFALPSGIAVNVQPGDVATGLTSGATVQLDGTAVQYGNYTGLHSFLSMGTAYRPLTDRNPQIRWGQGHVVLGTDQVLKDVVAANGADPNNLTEVTQRSPINVTSTGYDEADNNSYVLDFKLVNWHDADDLNSGSIASANEVTLGAWYDLGNAQPLGTTTTDGAITAIRATGAGPSLAKDIWNYAAQRTGDQQFGHSAGATIVFAPDPDADGYRADWPSNWQGGDFPVDGDNVALNGNIMQSFMTFRLADLDFGAGGGLVLFGGLVSCSSSQTVTAGFVELKNAAKFRVSGTQTTAYNVIADNGRYEVDGTISGISGSFAGKSQCIIYGGGSLTIDTGETLALTGSNVKAGFDGTTGTASLVLNGQLALIAENGALPRIRKVRTGRFGLENLGNDVEGQPVQTQVQASVQLGGGILIDASGVSPGTYTVIEADNLSGSFDTADIVGGTATLQTDLANGRLNVVVG